MINLSHRLSWIIPVIVLNIFTGSGAAGLPENLSQSLHISSNHALSDGRRNITIYEGNAELAQGALKILADKITIHHDNAGISEIIAIGQPARYQQQTEIDKGDIVAKANTITYQWLGRKILLRGNASIAQDGTEITGEVIDYDIGATVMSASGNERIQMVIPPIDNN